MVCLSSQAPGQLREVAGPFDRKRPISLRNIFADQCVLIGLKVDLMRLAALAAPFAGGGLQSGMQRLKVVGPGHEAMQVRAAVLGHVKGEGMGRSLTKGRLERCGHSAPQVVENAALGLFCAFQDGWAEVDADGDGVAGV